MAQLQFRVLERKVELLRCLEQVLLLTMEAAGSLRDSVAEVVDCLGGLVTEAVGCLADSATEVVDCLRDSVA